MSSEFEECVHDIVGAENARHGDIYDAATVSRIGMPGFKAGISDSPDIYRLDGRRRAGDAILFVSNADYPDTVDIAARKTAAAQGAISAAAGRHVLMPVSVGRQAGRSYALYPRQRALSKNRALRAVQVSSVKGPIFKWLGEIGSDTQIPVTSDTDLRKGFLDPYSCLREEKAFSTALRDQAAHAITEIEDGTFRPVSVLQHGDFWHGNILLKASGLPWPVAAQSFSVIDWGASAGRGYPYIDLLRFSQSIRHRDGALKQSLARYNSACNFSGGELLNYLCAHVGSLGIERGHFPFERYVQSMERLFATAARLA